MCYRQRACVQVQYMCSQSVSVHVCVCVRWIKADICVGRDWHSERIRLSSWLEEEEEEGRECDFGMVMNPEGNIAIWCLIKIKAVHKSGQNVTGIMIQMLDTCMH